jgi:hypothetical protein
MPLPAHNQGDLAQVAQYMRVQSAAGAVRGQLIDYLWEEIAKRSMRAQPGDPFRDLPLNRAKPEDAITDVGRRLRRTDPDDPYRVAAALPVSVYVTAGVTDLLQHALREADPPRDPVTMSFSSISIPELGVGIAMSRRSRISMIRRWNDLWFTTCSVGRCDHARLCSQRTITSSGWPPG